jgi:hypothetical protein
VNDPHTAQDLQSLVEKLTLEEQVRLAKLALRLASKARSVKAYAESPPADTEFASDQDSLAWEAEGWDEFSAEG